MSGLVCDYGAKKRGLRTQIYQGAEALGLASGLLAAGRGQMRPAVTVATRRDVLDSSRVYTRWSALRRPRSAAR
jgi:hypothetical protein